MQYNVQSFLLEIGQFKNQKPNKRVIDSSTSTLGYTLLNDTNFSIDNTQEKYYFSNPNSQGPPCFLDIFSEFSVWATFFDSYQLKIGIT